MHQNLLKDTFRARNRTLRWIAFIQVNCGQSSPSGMPSLLALSGEEGNSVLHILIPCLYNPFKGTYVHIYIYIDLYIGGK